MVELIQVAQNCDPHHPTIVLSSVSDRCWEYVCRTQKSGWKINTMMTASVVTKMNLNMQIRVCLFKSTVVAGFNLRRPARKWPVHL